jgi:hypothetical protein
MLIDQYVVQIRPVCLERAQGLWTSMLVLLNCPIYVTSHMVVIRRKASHLKKVLSI